jgi:hybrid cluster-associated redox disulfide protein
LRIRKDRTGGARQAEPETAEKKGRRMGPDIDDPDLTLDVLFRAWPEAARVFLAHRMACVGCPVAPFHTVRDCCAQYRLDEPAFRAELRAAIRTRPRSARRAGAVPSP